MLLVRLAKLTAGLAIGVFDLAMLWLTVKFLPSMRCDCCDRADLALIKMKNGSIICYGCRLGFAENKRLRP